MRPNPRAGTGCLRDTLGWVLHGMDLERLRSIVGEDGLTEAAELSRYAVSGVLPRAAAAPATREDAAALISLAREEGWGLTPYGGGTQIDFGFPPRRLDLVLSTRRLDRVVDYQPDDMTVTVEPGVTLERLQAELARRGQFLPLNPPLAKRATAGGMMAAATSGPWRAQFGTPRDWVIGCRVVDSSGQEIRGGGLVVKNVAGYDLPKLYTGSFGTLGLITEVTFKVMPAPPAVGVCTVEVSDPDALEALTAAVQGSDLQPASFELRRTWEAVLEFRHVPEAVEWQLGHTETLAKSQGASFRRVPPEAVPELLASLQDRAAGSAFEARLSTVSSQVASLTAAVSAACAEHRPDARVQGSLATGQVFVGADGGTEALATALREAASKAGGACVFPRLPAELVGSVDPWGKVGPELELMRGLKQKLDSHGLFSPGRFAGGL